MPNTFLDPTTEVAVKVTGLTGATAASRYVGATASGAPASGTFALGDWTIDQTAKIWICTTAGTIGSGCVFTAISGGGGAVATDVIWDAKGDLAVGTGADTAAKLIVGSNGQSLIADSTQTTGLKWGTPTPSSDPLLMIVLRNLYK